MWPNTMLWLVCTPGCRACDMELKTAPRNEVALLHMVLDTAYWLLHGHVPDPIPPCRTGFDHARPLSCCTADCAAWREGGGGIITGLDYWMHPNCCKITCFLSWSFQRSCAYIIHAGAMEGKRPVVLITTKTERADRVSQCRVNMSHVESHFVEIYSS